MANGTFSPDDVETVLSESKPAIPTTFSSEDVEETFSEGDVAETIQIGLESFKQKSEEELRRDKTFSPVLFGAANEESLISDPENLNKAVQQYKTREIEGTTLAEKGKALFTGVLPAGKAILKGAIAAGKIGIKTFPPALIARAAKAGFKGEKGLEEFAKEFVKESVETAASVELAGAGTADLARRASREISEGLAKTGPAGRAILGGPVEQIKLVSEAVRGKPTIEKQELTDEQWRERYLDDVAAQKQVEKVAQGNGPLIQALKIDAERLAPLGIELDSTKIEELSAVTDPINFIPFGATIGVVSKVGRKITQSVIARAATPKQAAAFAESLNKFRDLAASGTTATGKAVEGLGKGITAVGRVAEKGATALGITGTGGILGTGAGLGQILGSDIYTGLAIGGAVKIAPKVAQVVGRGVTAAGRAVPAIAGVAAEGAKGLAEGLLLSVPFEIGARPEEEKFILGAAGLGGISRAGVAGGARAGRAAGAAAQNVLSETIFRQAQQADAPPSKGPYGTEPTLDTTHDAILPSLDPQSQKLVNWTRERFRDSGAEIYVLDEPTFRTQAGTGNAHGMAIHVGETITPAGEVKPFFRILLNASAEALPHELFHALEVLDPTGAEALRKSVLDSLTPEQKKSFETYYNTLRNDGRPEAAWTTRLSPEGVASELGAEAFSRVFLGQDLSGVATPVQRKAALFLSNVLEKLGVPLAREGEKPGAPGISTLGLRPGAESVRVGQDWIKNILGKIEKQGNILPETPVKSKLFAGVRPEDITVARRPEDIEVIFPIRPTEVTPPVRPEIISGPPEIVPPNIRVTPEQQRDFSARRAEETGIEKARIAAKTPEEKAIIESISQSFGKVLEIDHRGVRTISSPEAPLERTPRRAEHEAAYIAEGMGAAPESVRSAYQKVFSLVRLDVVGGKPQLIAMSLDKVIANVHKVVKDAVAKGVSERIPYQIAEGKLTDAAWKQVVDDLQSYTENQSNGYRGDGQRLTRPTEDIGASIPAENPGYNPVQIAEDKALFLNLLQGLNPPLTARVTGSKLPGNVKAQIIAEINLRQPEVPSVIRPSDIQKQQFKAPPSAVGRAVRETNPLRNELAAAGVPVRELIEVTERINVGDVLSVRPRPDLRFAAPVTDITRAGFLPAGKTVESYGRELLNSGPEEWRNLTAAMEGGLTGGAFKLGQELTKFSDLDQIKKLKDESINRGLDAMREGDLDNAIPWITKGQFFREAEEAATGTGSAGLSLRRDLGDNYKPPFPEGRAITPDLPTVEKSFLPAENFTADVDPVNEAAIRLPSGKIFTGAWHGEAAMKIIDAAGKGELDRIDIPKGGFEETSFGTDGFVTRSGKFLDRAEALKHAQNINQLREEPTDRFAQEGILESTRLADTRSFLPKEFIESLISPDQNTPSKEGFLYHATNVENLTDIAKSKKVKTFPPGFGTDQNTWPDGSVQKRSYWIQQAKYAFQFSPEEGKSVLLRVPKSEKFKRESTGDYFSTSPIPVSNLEVLTSEGWKLLDQIKPEGTS